MSLNRLRPVLNRTTGRLSLQVERPLSIHGNFRLVSYVVTSDTLAAYGQEQTDKTCTTRANRINHD